ncbi:hypothetical protein DJ92_5648 (plasmid) [Bacillus pseudomycoides]|uniref:DUF1433 domain-containing protein n=1 Tax=Bacillus pseudomycoides TaxID=64104 RepID=UPI0004ED849A|nr:DUF1433 domain-containing protein [Bacillus pseudomycoides]AIK35337.1 hypothetical protein DJ92_5735 [Bacillus pseudomycoides]AIK35632.1 hypothetical protein DJ92_5648 [Bacillus pseudomycoides]PGD91191.1 DUF1433 domain-containing protein [Bacillus pseudomycoides]
MKKIMILIVSAMVIIAGGYFTMEYLNQKEKEQVQEEKFWKAQKIRVEKYIRYNVKNVKSITFTEHKVNPMGIPTLSGYINDDEELDFTANISTTKDFENKFTRSGKLDDMVKKPAKSVSEIEKEEKEKIQE